MVMGSGVLPVSRARPSISYVPGSSKLRAPALTNSMLAGSRRPRAFSYQPVNMENRPKKTRHQIPFSCSLLVQKSPLELDWRTRLTDRRSRTATMVGSFIIRACARCVHWSTSPFVSNKHPSQGSALTGFLRRLCSISSMKTKTTEKNITSATTRRTIAIPLHCSWITLRTRRYAWPGVMVPRTLLEYEFRPELPVVAELSEREARYTLIQ